MTVSGRINKKKSVIITPERLYELCEIILKHCSRLEFTAETNAKTSLSFENIDELLKYDNYKSRRIIELEITGYIDYSRKITLTIGYLGINLLTNYGRTIEINYNLDSIDKETIFKSDFEKWYEKSTSNFWILGKFSLNGLLSIPSAFITFIRWICGNKVNVDISNAMVFVAIILLTIVCVGILYLIKLFDAYVIGNLFPGVIFNWGEEANRFEKWSKFRSNLLWGIIIAGILGLVTTYLYDTLKGI